METAVAPEAPLADSLTRLDLAHIYKEALTNIVKHARARQVSVRLDIAPDELRLVVQDDGVWLPPRLAEGEAKSRGLSNLHRRAERLGGRLVIGPPDGGAAAGTAVRLHLPLRREMPRLG
jgi:signal transduction histidine kinase